MKLKQFFARKQRPQQVDWGKNGSPAVHSTEALSGPQPGRSHQESPVVGLRRGKSVGVSPASPQSKTKQQKVAEEHKVNDEKGQERPSIGLIAPVCWWFSYPNIQ